MLYWHLCCVYWFPIMELTNPPGCFVIRNHVSTGARQPAAPFSNLIHVYTGVLTCTAAYLRKPVTARSWFVYISTPTRRRRSGEKSGCLINTSGRLKPLTQWAAAVSTSTTQAAKIHNWPQRAIIKSSVCLPAHKLLTRIDIGSTQPPKSNVSMHRFHKALTCGISMF